MTTSAVGAPMVVPADVVTFKDWTVGCDNGLSCQAVALMPENFPEGMLPLVVQRAAGNAGELAIEISGLAPNTGTYRISVDGRTASSGAAVAGTGRIRITGTDALKLARALAKGQALRIADEAGVSLGQVSLAGSTAALRYIDAAQGRARTKSAIVATGRRTATARRNARVPVIAAMRIQPSDMLPDTVALVALSENSPCAKERIGATQDAAFSLGSTRALVLLNCGAGAYNASAAAYIGERDGNGKWSFSPAGFDYAPNRLTGMDSALLINATWDSAAQTISSYGKSRGIGDCGSAERYVWDGGAFRLVEARVMNQCRGSVDWIPVWQAEVKLSG